MTNAARPVRHRPAGAPPRPRRAARRGRLPARGGGRRDRRKARPRLTGRFAPPRSSVRARRSGPTILARAALAAAAAVADAEVLDLEEGAHDLVVHGLALHWANDPVGQLVQARRALAARRPFHRRALRRRDAAELRAALAEAEVATLGGLSPRVAPMGEIRDLGGLLQRAGFALPVADSRRFDVSYPRALALMRDLRAMGETNVMRDRLRRPIRRAMLARAAARLCRALRAAGRPGARDLRGHLPDRLGAGAGPAEAASPGLGGGPAGRRARRRRAQRRRAGAGRLSAPATGAREAA